MATESIGKMVYLTPEMADAMIAQIDEFDENPPEAKPSIIKWADSKKLAAAIRRKYDNEG